MTPSISQIPEHREVVSYDPSAHFSNRVQRWAPGAIRSLLPLEALPGMISLVAGKPNPEVFPISKISISVNSSEEEEIIELKGQELRNTLQYGLPGGDVSFVKESRHLPSRNSIPSSDIPVVQWIKKLQIQVHGIQDQPDWGCCVGNGSQDLIHKAFQVFTDPGDAVLIETPAYPGVVGFLRADKHQQIEIPTDADGLDPHEVERTFLDWPEDRPRPTVLYTIPTGSNPTGRCTSEARKAQVLRLARRFNFMIFEDDAYYFLTFEEAPAKRPRSYLAMEREVNGETGRVIRFDSLSKTLSPGMRLGFVTGPLSVVQLVTRITENINLQPSSTTQLLAFSLLRHWGHSGFLEHCTRAAKFYRRQRDAFAAAAERHLRGKATWEVPSAGMFFWITLRLPPGRDSFEILSTRGTECGVLAIPGVAFMPNARQTCNLRASFSLIDAGMMDEACRRIARLVDEAWADCCWKQCMPWTAGPAVGVMGARAQAAKS